MFPFRMISDTRIECRHADSRWSGSPCAPVGARRGKELSREARVRLDWMDFYHRCRNVARTCRHFGISRQTFYRWHRRYNSYNLTTLEARSPPPSSPPPAHLVSPPGRSRPGFAPPLSPLGQGQSWRPAAPVHIRISTSMGGPHPDPDETPGDGWANPRARAWPVRAAPCAPCRGQTEQYAVSRPGDLLQVPAMRLQRQTPSRAPNPVAWMTNLTSWSATPLNPQERGAKSRATKRPTPGYRDRTTQRQAGRQ